MRRQPLWRAQCLPASGRRGVLHDRDADRSAERAPARTAGAVVEGFLQQLQAGHPVRGVAHARHQAGL